MTGDEGSADAGGPSPIGEIRAIDSIFALISSGGRVASLEISVSTVVETTFYGLICRSFHPLA
jgi:hypothetical protein